METVEYIKENENLKEVLRIEKTSRIEKKVKALPYIKEIRKNDQNAKSYFENNAKNIIEENRTKCRIKKDLIYEKEIMNIEKKYELLVLKNPRNSLMSIMYDVTMSDYLRNEKILEMNDEKESKSPHEVKFIEESSYAPDRNDKSESTDLTGLSLSSSIVRKGIESDFTELKRQKYNQQDIDGKDKRSLGIILKKSWLHKLYYILVKRQKEMDIEFDTKNLCVKVLQYGKYDLTRCIMGSLILKRVQFISNENIEWINLPKEELWMEGIMEEETKNSYTCIFESRGRIVKIRKLIIENLGRIRTRRKRNHDRKTNKRKLKMEDVVLVLFLTNHNKLLMIWINSCRVVIEKEKNNYRIEIKEKIKILQGIVEEIRNKMTSLEIIIIEQEEDERREQLLMIVYKSEERIKEIKIKEKLLLHQEKDIENRFIKYKEMFDKSSSMVRRI